jgi:hypothetical protein
MLDPPSPEPRAGHRDNLYPVQYKTVEKVADNPQQTLGYVLGLFAHLRIPHAEATARLLTIRSKNSTLGRT